MTDCLFCKIVDGKIPATVEYEDEDVVAFADINPVAPVHVLIIPRKHIATMNDATDDDQLLMGKLLDCGRRLAANKGVAESGYRMVTNTMAGAGQSVFHVHVHLLAGRGFDWPPG